jgi:hypothetical protein
MTQGECMTITKQEVQKALDSFKYNYNDEDYIETLQRFVNHNFTNELTHHRMDYEAIKKAGWESPGELLSGYNYLLKKYNNLLIMHQDTLNAFDELECSKVFAYDTLMKTYTKLLVKYEDLVIETLENEQ